MIHSTAIIDKSAQLASDVTVGAYSIIGPDVEIGSGTEIGPHVVIQGPTKIGAHNKIFQFASVGDAPQDKKYHGEPTVLEIGDYNVIRESCTLNRGTVNGGGITKLGSHNLLMAYAHVAHDCIIGNHTILANSVSLAGHVIIDDYAILGGMSGVHQFCRIGSYSFAAGGSMIAKDVPPFIKVSGYYAKPFGLNTEGLRRHHFSAERINHIKQMYKIIYRHNLTAEEAIAELKRQFAGNPDMAMFVAILEQSERGVVR